MAEFGKKSMEKLETCDDKLKILFLHVVTHYDCTVVEGHRPENVQNEYFKTGKSKVKWPNSKHNSMPSKGIDVAPYLNSEISWDAKQCYNFAGFVMGCAAMLGIKIIWGGDWDSDRDIKDQTFNDLVHFQLV